MKDISHSDKRKFTIKQQKSHTKADILSKWVSSLYSSRHKRTYHTSIFSNPCHETDHVIAISGCWFQISAIFLEFNRKSSCFPLRCRIWQIFRHRMHTLTKTISLVTIWLAMFFVFVVCVCVLPLLFISTEVALKITVTVRNQAFHFRNLSNLNLFDIWE